MPAPTKKRLQVFVSSTFDDLRDERQAAVEAILQAGHIPAGMELFAAGDQSQMKVIEQWIDDSDAYMLILGGRYGSIEPTSGKSYTHLEYDYAVEKGKPLFACMIREAAAIKRGEQEGGSKLIERENPKELAAFREEVGGNLVELWEDEKDIKLGIIKALNEISRREHLGGWVRADETVDVPELTNEVARLSKENARLRANVPAREYCGLTYEEMLSQIEKHNLTEFLHDLYEVLAVSSGAEISSLRGGRGLQVGWGETEVKRFVIQLQRLGIVEMKRDYAPPSSEPKKRGEPTTSYMRFEKVDLITLSQEGRRFLNRWTTEEV